MSNDSPGAGDKTGCLPKIGHTVGKDLCLIRRNREWHHFDPSGTAQVITNNSAGVVSNNVYDIFGVLRYQQGSAQTPVPPRGWEGVTAR